MSKISEFLDFANGRTVKNGIIYYAIIWTNSGRNSANKASMRRQEIEDLIIWFIKNCKDTSLQIKISKHQYFCIRDYPTHLFLVMHFDYKQCKLRVIKCADLYKAWPKNGEIVLERLLDGKFKNYIWEKR